MTLLFKKKAEVVEKSAKLINDYYPSPVVIRLTRFAPVPFVNVVLTRKNVYLRDNGTCQYCGHNGGGLTIDHVVPKSKGGVETWENIVVACVRCNNKKGDRTPAESGMKLIRDPYRPPSSLYLQITRLGSPPQSWFPYFFNREGAGGKGRKGPV